MKKTNPGRPKGVGKYERPERKWPQIKRSGSSVGAWCYLCDSEHRWEQGCMRKSA